MDLSEIRNHIDDIDDQILDLFLKRMSYAHHVGEYKVLHDLPVYNIAREREILARMMEKSGDMDAYTYRLYHTFFELSRAYQASLYAPPSNVRTVIEPSLLPSDTVFPASGIVACQGVEGAYSQMAADRLFPHGTLMYFKNFEGVFDAVEQGLCDFGVLPIENSSNGSVRAVYDLLQARDVHIIRSARLHIRHELVVKPGAALSDIREIHSHEQGLGQCSVFLKSLGDQVTLVPCANTAMAAQHVANADDPSVASISSHDCASLYGLSALPLNIQNSDNNYTRFICISKQPAVYPGANLMTLILSTQHKPGALYEILAQFNALNVNLIKLESRPIVGHDFDFMFFFECEASVHDPKIISMLETFERICPSFRYLGNYSEV